MLKQFKITHAPQLNNTVLKKTDIILHAVTSKGYKKVS